jgi:predicted metal-dependent hydrolase
MFNGKKSESLEIFLDDISVEVTRKKVKNINLRVYPSRRKVKISAPWHLNTESIIQFAESKEGWIRKHLSNYRQPLHLEPPKFDSGEIHLYKRREYELFVEEHHGPPEVTLLEAQGKLRITVRHGSGREKRAKVLKEWYRARLKEQIPKLIEKWEKPMGVSVKEFGVKQMKTRWGSCNTRACRIWINLELAKKSDACLESGSPVGASSQQTILCTDGYVLPRMAGS